MVRYLRPDALRFGRVMGLVATRYRNALRDSQMQKQVEEIVALTLRVPASLKQRLDEQVSLNRSSQSSEMIRLMRMAWAEPAQREKAAG